MRMALVGLLFLAGVGLALQGWAMTGQLQGLGVMLLGLGALLGALALYNIPYRDKK